MNAVTYKEASCGGIAVDISVMETDSLHSSSESRPFCPTEYEWQAKPPSRRGVGVLYVCVYVCYDVDDVQKICTKYDWLAIVWKVVAQRLHAGVDVPRGRLAWRSMREAS